MKLTVLQLKKMIKEVLDSGNLSTSALRKGPPVNTNTPYPPTAKPLPVTLTPDQKAELGDVFRKLGAAVAAANKAAGTLKLIPGGLRIFNTLTDLEASSILLLKYLRND